MHEALTLSLSWGAGTILGGIFFGGLWWTTRKGMASKYAALWFSVSLPARMAIAVTGFYVVGHGHWERLVACLLGFVAARLIITWLTRAAKSKTRLTHGDSSCV